MVDGIRRGVKIAVGACVPHPRNYNQHSPAQVQALRESLTVFGQIPAIVVQAGPQAEWGVADGQFLVVKGHGLLAAAAQLTWAEIVADILPGDYPRDQVLAFLAADNELARLASPEEQQLALLVQELGGVDAQLAQLAAGSAGRVSELLDSLLTAEDWLAKSGTADLAGDAAAEWQTAVGQTWLIPSRTLPGQCHRLVIGDCTDPAVVAQLFQGARADTLLTDPPYGVDYAEKERAMRVAARPSARAQSQIKNDAIADYQDFFARFLKCAPLADYNTIFVFMMGVHLHHLRLAFDAAGCYFSQYLTWVKSRRVIGRTDFQWQTEFLALGGSRYLVEDAALLWDALKAAGQTDAAGEFLAELADAGFPALETGAAQTIVYGWRGRHKFYGKRGKRSTAIFADAPVKSAWHPTQKPPALLAQLLACGTRRGMLAYDPFAGSGSLLLAAEPLGRVCYMLELDVNYAAVILARAVAELGLEPYLAEEDKDGDGV